ncbi:MAG: TetR/AcrR family transcriptional regulator [Sphingomonas taxi]|uniref:TetR/AcrR family transcriptional regulator n=1 Tax=Sphingomonas taxi TaxID=1549858 RepID=A0A2W5NXI5_9SPHN|nr:MAG: TetR/AcrR family transcriptional regulator [Sphingomonas taxi]
MRYAKDHREKTRRRIVETASRALRRNGIGASGVVGLMSEAGLTQGGFYTHFASKDALVGEAIDHAQKNARRWLAGVAAAAREKQGDPVSAVIDAYLSVAHLDAAGGGCTLAALGSEIGHQSDAIRRSAFSGMADIIELLAEQMPAERRHLASAFYGLLAGTLQLARLAPTREEQEAVLEAGRRAARDITGAR